MDERNSNLMDQRLEQLEQKLNLLLERTEQIDKVMETKEEINFLQEAKEEISNLREAKEEVIRPIEEKLQEVIRPIEEKPQEVIRPIAGLPQMQPPLHKSLEPLPPYAQFNIGNQNQQANAGYQRDRQDTHQQKKKEEIQNANKEALEFRIGASLFSIVGVLFVLIAFITFGLDFLSGAVQGAFLYVISFAILGVSELLIQKKHARFSIGITGLGICALYVSTIINYLYLNTIGSLLAIGLTLLVAVLAFFISKRKDSGVIRIISIIGCYICFFPVRGFASDLDFLTITVILLLINFICIFVPVSKMEQTIHYVHIISNLLFTLLLIGEAWNSKVGDGLVLLFMMTALIVQNLIFARQKKTTGALVVFGVTLSILAITTSTISLEIENVFLPLILTFAVSLFFFLFAAGKRERWIQYYYFILTTVLCVAVIGSGPIPEALIILAAFIAVKLTADIKEAEGLNCIITVFAILIGISFYKEWYSWLYFAAFLLAAFRLRYFTMFYKISMTLFVFFLLMLKLQWGLFLPMAMGALCLYFLIFAWYPRYRRMQAEKPQKGYFYLNVSLMAVLYLLLPFVTYNGKKVLGFVPAEAICNVFMLLFGLLVCLFFLKREYGFPWKNCRMITAVFLTYMIFAVDFRIPIIMSVLLMVVALGSVGAGFIMRERSIRLYGLFLSLFVCAKIVLYDFLEIASLQRMILFLIAGIIALAISFLYLYLEKALKRTTTEENDQQEKIDTFHNL